jgi:hypothetical protein
LIFFNRIRRVLTQAEEEEKELTTNNLSWPLQPIQVASSRDQLKFVPQIPLLHGPAQIVFLTHNLHVPWMPFDSPILFRHLRMVCAIVLFVCMVLVRKFQRQPEEMVSIRPVELLWIARALFVLMVHASDFPFHVIGRLPAPASILPVMELATVNSPILIPKRTPQQPLLLVPVVVLSFP